MKRTQKSQKRTKFLLLLIVLTAILSITATYAWFSTQRDVDITGMKLNVEVAESMQISLDGDHWTQSIQIVNMRQLYGTYNAPEGTDDASIYQAIGIGEDTTNQNYVPKELLPVSSAGEIEDGQLKFVTGTLANVGGTLKLSGITACSEADFTGENKDATIATRETENSSHPYLVFDMYLRNISKKADGEFDDLQLNAGSMAYLDTVTVGDQEADAGEDGIIKVDADEAKSGLEYTPRVGMIVYKNTTATVSTGETVRTLAPSTDNTDKVAIWEPNHLNHTQAVVADNGRGITNVSQAVDTYAIKSAAATAEPNEIADVNATTGTNLEAVQTFKPAYTLPLYDEDTTSWTGGVTAATTITTINSTAETTQTLGIEANKISKVRVYVWLEGQDPDCVELASTGDMLNVTLKLTKPSSGTGSSNTYATSN